MLGTPLGLGVIQKKLGRLALVQKLNLLTDNCSHVIFFDPVSAAMIGAAAFTLLFERFNLSVFGGRLLYGFLTTLRS